MSTVLGFLGSFHNKCNVFTIICSSNIPRIASKHQLNLAENIPGLGSGAYFLIICLDYSKFSPEKQAHRVNVTKRYCSKINKSQPPLVAVLQ